MPNLLLQQVFHLTHSPYLLRKFEASEHQLVMNLNLVGGEFRWRAPGFLPT